MLDPYRMVFINVIALIIVIVCLLIYRIIFPKRKINYLYLLVVFSILPLISLLRKGVYESGDMSIHIYHAISFFNSIKDGVLVPKWGPELNAGYGYPVFIFMYLLPYYLISFVHSFGISFISSFKLVLAISYLTSGIFFFKWASSHFGEKVAFGSAIFFLFAPYHLVDLHFRVDIGEIVALSIIPLSFLVAKKINDTQKPIFYLINSFVITLLIISHPALSIASIPLLVLYLFFMAYQTNKDWFIVSAKYIFSILGGIGLSSFYWFVTLVNLQYVRVFPFEQLQFVNIDNLLYSPWRYGLLFQGPYGELSFLIGYAQFLVVILGLYLYFSKRMGKENIFFLFWFILFFVTIFFMLPLSRELWKIIPLIDNFQFTYRLLGINIFITSAIAGIVLKKYKNSLLFYLIVFFAISTTILNWGNRKVIPEINDSALILNLPYSTVEGAGVSQGISKWTDINQPWFSEIPSKPIEVVEGRASFKQIFKERLEHVYIIQSEENSLIRENTLYFPGWNININGEEQTLLFDEKGIINFRLDQGLYKVNLSYNEPTQKYANALTMLTLFVIFAYYFFEKRSYIRIKGKKEKTNRKN